MISNIFLCVITVHIGPVFIFPTDILNINVAFSCYLSRNKHFLCLLCDLSVLFCSGLWREIASLANGQPIRDAKQTDAAINLGDSGGPLFDSAKV